MRLLFLIFTEIAKLNTREMFCNHQIAKIPAKCNFVFPIVKLSTHKILIPLKVDVQIILINFSFEIKTISYSSLMKIFHT